MTLNLSLSYRVILGDSDGKESTCSVGDLGLIPRSGRSPGEVEKGMAIHSSILAWSIPQRSLAGYTPWGLKESNTTEQLTHRVIIPTLWVKILNSERESNLPSLTAVELAFEPSFSGSRAEAFSHAITLAPIFKPCPAYYQLGS